MLKRALYSIGKEEAVPYIYNSWYKGRFAAAYLGFCEGNDEWRLLMGTGRAGTGPVWDRAKKASTKPAGPGRKI